MVAHATGGFFVDIEDAFCIFVSVAPGDLG